MSDPFTSGAFQPGVEDHQLQSERMGRGFVTQHEQPRPEYAMSKDGPVELPWRTGKPIGHQINGDFSHLGRKHPSVLGGEQGNEISLTLPLTDAELRTLDRAAREAGIIDSVNRGIQRPETDAFNESDYLLTKDSIDAGEPLVRCTLTPGCIYVQGHDGPCHPESQW